MSDTVAAAEVLSPDAVETFSRARGEPAWLRETRRRASDLARRLPLPAPAEEKWRRTDLSGLDLSALRPLVDGGRARPQGLDAHLALAEARGGLLVSHNGAPAVSELSDDLRAQGVVFTGLDGAVRAHPELLRRYLHTVIRPDESVFRALHAAFAAGGTVLHVPRGVEVAAPLLAYTWLDRDGALAAPHTLIVAEEQARVTLIEGFGSAAGGTRTVVVGAAEIVAGPGAEVRYVTLQDWGRPVWEFGSVRARLDRDASLRVLAAGIGGALVKVDVESYLDGRGAAAEMLGVFFEDDAQHYDFHTLQEHRAPNTTSDLLYKYALRDTARSVFAGMIRVHPGAQKTNAFQSNRNMLLSDHARSDSKPELEIMANDLRCTHGSATSRIEEEHLFYLMSRGLNRRHATRMIVEGFFAEVFDRVPLPGLRARLESAVAEKMGVEALR